jgi:hypothetical protein
MGATGSRGVEPNPTDDDDKRNSSMRLEFTLAIGYQRRRVVLADRWEARLTTIGLFLAGVAVTVFVLVMLIPRLLSAL